MPWGAIHVSMTDVETRLLFSKKIYLIKSALNSNAKSVAESA
jgi:hypothetical protein